MRYFFEHKNQAHPTVPSKMSTPEEYLEEQQGEIESLEAIYSNSLKVLDSEPPSFSLELVPHPDSDEPSHVSMRLIVQYSETYPDTVPSKMTIESLKGLSKAQVRELTKLAQTIAEENLGMGSMSSVASDLQEWLVQHNIPSDTSLHDKMKAEKQLKARLERLTFGEEGKTDDHTAADVHGTCTEFETGYRRKIGTECNPETFLKWNNAWLSKYKEAKKL